ncbi:MAG: endonuclease domain-containing protein [Elusimicrobia bacterium]|nr:endonuclease domain-containing protein [Elusimicrobiota bacterium]
MQFVPFARQLRRKLTDAERRLWTCLRSRQFQGYKFRRQQPLGPYIVDFCCFEHRLVVELDGGQHTQQREADAQRTSFLKCQGFEVIRFWDNDVLNNLNDVLEAITLKLKTPSPSPLPSREREAHTHTKVESIR